MPEYQFIVKTVIVFSFCVSGIIRGYYELNYRKVQLLKVLSGFREKFFVRFVGMCITLPVITFIVTDWLSFASQGFPFWLALLGAFIMLINLVYFYRIHRALGKNWSPIIVISKDQQLIQTGPYEHIRHPMYASIFIHLFAMWLTTDNWLVGGLGLLAFLTSYLIRVGDEETLMKEAFGQAYEAYMKTTGRLFPRMKKK